MRQLANFVTLQLLRAYKWAISPMFPPACRYVPTCSQYAMEAIARFGVLRGGLKAGARLLRCHPFVKGGYDPVVRVPSCGKPTEHVEPYCKASHGNAEFASCEHFDSYAPIDSYADFDSYQGSPSGVPHRVI
jgi:uncharacterized protein